jgi:anaerobic magnesium-protoporphyrin IX monomethyl ester cyclase
MRILLINPPFHSATTSYGLGAQVPLGLVLVGGALIAPGHDVMLIDAGARRLSNEDIVKEAMNFRPDVIMTGHAGSTAAHPIAIRMARALKAALPMSMIVYGGVFPTYHGKDILAAEPPIDVIVKGEGKQTIVNLAGALETGGDLSAVKGIVYRDNPAIRETAPAEMIADLDRFRAGWELIEDWDLYQCWGLGRAAVVQFSRGCPHPCTYCGQRGILDEMALSGSSKSGG